MDLLLDTHAFIWWDSGASRLSRTAASAIANPENQVFVSAASIWEIGIKRALGRLAFAGSPTAAIVRNQFLPLPISPEDAEATAELPPIHNDPFDRILVAQALTRNLVIVTADQQVERYAVPRLNAR